MERARFALVTVLVLAAGCELGPNGLGSDDVSIATRATNRSCPSDVRTGAAVGQPCAVSGDCAEICCGCSAGTDGFAAQVCINGVCQSATTGCPKAEANSPERCSVP